MKKLINKLSLSLKLIPVVLALLAGTMVFAYDGSPATLDFGGSTTVRPIIEAMINKTPGEPTVPGEGSLVINSGISGSGAGQTALLNLVSGVPGTPLIDIAMTSSAVGSTNLGYGVLWPMAIAKDGVCVIVNKALYDAGVTEITVDQLRTIYTSTSINTLTWDDVIEPGVTNQGLVGVYVKPRARETTSGTRETFLTRLGLPSGFAAEVTTINALLPLLPRFTASENMAAAINSAADGIGQIGYVGLSFADDNATYPNIVKIPVAAGSTTNYVMPTRTTILDETYYLGRNLYLIIRTDLLGSANSNLQAFLDWILLPNGGQYYVEKAGYISLIPDYDVVLSMPYQVHLNSVPVNCHVQAGGIIDVSDLGQVRLVDWFTSGAPHWIRSDLNRDGIVDVTDMGSIRLVYWFGTWIWPAHPGFTNVTSVP